MQRVRARYRACPVPEIDMPRRTDTRSRPRRRGAAVVAVVVLMLIVALVIVGMVTGGARDQGLTVRRLQTVQAFYAAEAGMYMALREVKVNTDEDSDGGVGTISDDSNDGTDPQIGSGYAVVTSSYAAPTTTLTSTGRDGVARRKIQASYE
jgi:Tfp pilus assembly protein PilX